MVTENKTSITVQISSKQANRLDAYCDLEGRIKSWVIEQSLQYFLDNEEDVIKAIRQKRILKK